MLGVELLGYTYLYCREVYDSFLLTSFGVPCCSIEELSMRYLATAVVFSFVDFGFGLSHENHEMPDHSSKHSKYLCLVFWTGQCRDDDVFRAAS